MIGAPIYSSSKNGVSMTSRCRFTFTAKYIPVNISYEYRVVSASLDKNPPTITLDFYANIESVFDEKAKKMTVQVLELTKGELPSSKLFFKKAQELNSGVTLNRLIHIEGSLK